MTFLTRFFVCSSRSSSISTGHDFLLERKVGGVNHHLHNTLGQLTTAWEGLLKQFLKYRHYCTACFKKGKWKF